MVHNNYYCLSFIIEKVKDTLSRPTLCTIPLDLVGNLPEVSRAVVTTAMYILTMLKKVFFFSFLGLLLLYLMYLLLCLCVMCVCRISIKITYLLISVTHKFF